MPSFTLAIANTKSAYDAFLTARATTTAAIATRAALSAPTKPTVTLLDADWNDYTALKVTYDAAVVTADNAVAVATAAQRTAELAVIASLGYVAPPGVQNVQATVCLGEWVKVVGTGGGILTYTNYIGASFTATALVISTTLPTQAFPNV